MKARFLTFAALVLTFATAQAQETEALPEPFEPYFALEFGTGIAPIHTLVNRLSLPWNRDLAEIGLQPDTDYAFCPSFSLSAVWHTTLRWEYVLTGGLSWCNYRATQFDTFGWTPEGKPRYDLDKPLRSFRRNSEFAGALFFQARRFWNPTQKVKLYSAAGVGLYTDGKEFVPLPSVTPIAVRFGTGPLKFFVEHAYSLAATGWNFGLGWTF